jgi:hypothetical protein
MREGVEGGVTVPIRVFAFRSPSPALCVKQTKTIQNETKQYNAMQRNAR